MYKIAGRYNIKNLIIEQKPTEYVELSTGRVLKAIPKTEQKPNVLYSYPIVVIFNAGYRDIAEFIREVQNSERFVSVNTLSVKKAKRWKIDPFGIRLDGSTPYGDLRLQGIIHREGRGYALINGKLYGIGDSKVIFIKCIIKS